MALIPEDLRLKPHGPRHPLYQPITVCSNPKPSDEHAVSCLGPELPILHVPDGVL